MQEAYKMYLMYLSRLPRDAEKPSPAVQPHSPLG